MNRYFIHIKDNLYIDLEKAKRMPIGTVSKGRKKVAEGKWVPIKENNNKNKEYSEAEKNHIFYHEKMISELKEEINRIELKYGQDAVIGYKKKLESHIKDLNEIKKHGLLEVKYKKGIVTTDSDKFNKNIIDIINSNEYSFYGIRVISKNPLKEKNKKYQIGDILPSSYKWDDGDTTNEKLFGTSAIYVNEFTKNIINKVSTYVHNGSQIVLLGSDDIREGNDIGEIEMKNAKVLSILNY